MSAMRCLWASVVGALLYGLNSSVPNPGIHIFQLRSGESKMGKYENIVILILLEDL